MLREAELNGRYPGSRQGDTPGKRLRLARLEKKMTIRELAKGAGLTPEAISSIETDKNPASLRSLKKLSEALGQALQYLGCFEGLPEDTLGQRLRKARMCKGLSLQEASAVLGVDWTTLRRWEQDRSTPLHKFHSSVDWFIRDGRGDEKL